ncbi:TPA: hypothetical protein ACFP4Q_002088 [Neisseria weaveri]
MARKNIHLTENTEQYIIGRTTADQPNWSGTINSAFELLSHLAKTEKPELSGEEWAEIYNIYAGSELSKLCLPINIAADLMMHYGATITSQLPEHCQPLVERLVNMTQAQQFAILDTVRVYWSAQ